MARPATVRASHVPSPLDRFCELLCVVSLELRRASGKDEAVTYRCTYALSVTRCRWSLGEDTVLGMWVHSSPFRITALHWGWDKIHDLCFLCKECDCV